MNNFVKAIIMTKTFCKKKIYKTNDCKSTGHVYYLFFISIWKSWLIISVFIFFSNFYFFFAFAYLAWVYLIEIGASWYDLWHNGEKLAFKIVWKKQQMIRYPSLNPIGREKSPSLTPVASNHHIHQNTFNSDDPN